MRANALPLNEYSQLVQLGREKLYILHSNVPTIKSKTNFPYRSNKKIYSLHFAVAFGVNAFGFLLKKFLDLISEDY